MSESFPEGSTLTLGYEPPQPPATHLWRNWLLATTAGELLGLILPAVMGAIAASLYSPISLAITILSGAGSAACVAWLQALVLKRFLPGFPQMVWMSLSAIAAAFTWTIGLVPSQVSQSTLVNPILLTVADLLLAIALVFAIGLAQWSVLRRWFRRAIWWMPATAFAKTLGAMVPSLGGLLVSEQSGELWRISVAIACGVLMGAIAGAITGATLVWLDKQRIAPLPPH